MAEYNFIPNKKETSLRNKIAAYSNRISQSQVRLNRLVNDYNLYRNDLLKMKARVKEMKDELVSEADIFKHGKVTLVYDGNITVENDDYIKLTDRIKAAFDQISELSSILSYLNEPIRYEKQQIKMLQRVQSLYIEKLENYHSNIHLITT